MAKTNFRTWTTSELVTADMLNEQIRDNGNEIWKGTTAGDMDYYASATTKDRIPIGSAGLVLTSSGSVPYWDTITYGSFYRSSAQSISNNTLTDITSYDSVTEYGGEFYTSGSYITIPETGYYIFTANGYFDGHATAGKRRELAIIYEGSAAFATQTVAQDSDSSAMHLSCSFLYGFSAGARVSLRVIQNSGTSLNFNGARLSIQRIK